MPQVIVTTTELTSLSGVATNTGTAFVAGACDQGPPAGGPSYVQCQSLAQYVTAFGPRTSTSATLYDWLDEFFHDGGQGAVAYVTRVTDNTATSATLTLNDGLASPKPTVAITAATAGLAGNTTYVQVLNGTAATFTAGATGSSTALTAVSSFTNIGVGTKVTGTGVPAGTYIASVTPGSSTATLSQAFTGSTGTVTFTPATFTVEVEDSLGNVLETWGPFNLTSQLFAVTTSAFVTFAQSTGSGNTTNQPAVAAATALSGGADASDLTDSSHVAALANFPAALGPGQVALPGKTSATAWSGLVTHATGNNRYAVLDMTDGTAAAAVTQAAQGGWTTSTSALLIQGSLTLPPYGTSTANRTVAGSAAVCALRAQVGATRNQNAAPIGLQWLAKGPGLKYPIGFTAYYGPLAGTTAGTFSAADVQTMETAGINCFANLRGPSGSALCLYGFVASVGPAGDVVFWQASAAVERMNLTYLCQLLGNKYLGANIDPSTITALGNDLNGIGSAEYNAGALSNIKPDGTFGTANDAFTVLIGSPVNTAATAQAGQLNAQLQVRLTPYADKVTFGIQVVALTSQVTQP
jgi:hypothetical protein